MKKFLINCGIFFGLAGTFLLVPTLIFFFRLRSISFKIPDDKTIVFCGDSHFTTGINPEIIPNSYNFSEHGDHYINQYLRLKKLLAENPQIKTVFVTCWPSSLAPTGDSRFFNNYGMQTRFVYNFPLYSSKEWALQLTHSPIRVFKFMFEKPRNILGKAIESDEFLLSRLGRDESTKNNTVRGLHKKTIEEMKAKMEREHSISSNSLQLEYLHKIVELVKKHNAKIIFINTPIRNAEIFYDIDFFEKLRSREFSNVEYWNYQEFSIPDDNCWRDFNHLNQWGAEIFSRELARRIEAEGLN